MTTTFRQEGSVAVKAAMLSYLWRNVVTSEPRKIGAPGLSGSGIRFRCLVAAEMASTCSGEISMLQSPLVVYVGVGLW